MSENLEELHRKVGLLFQNGRWDEAIVVFTQILRLEDVPEGKAAAYTGRGLAYNFKGDHDRALADCDKAIELNPQGAAAYSTRSFAYHAKEDYDRALADCDKAIELNPQDAAAYGSRGIAYGFKGDYDRALADCDKAIELNPQDAAAYGGRGIAYGFKGDYDRALADYDKAIELNPHDKGLKSNKVLVYIIDSLECITSDSEERAGLFKSYWALAYAIYKISTELFYKFPDAEEVAHYTSLHGVRALAERDNPFRLYNSAYMNDPEEGQVFFEIMKKVMKKEEDIDVEAIFYKPDSEDPHSSPAYIGSFVKIESQNDQAKDKLFLWRTYGTHNNEEAGGACLIFNKDQFAQDVPPLTIGPMSGLEYVVEQGEPTRQNDPPALYEVVYKSEIGKSESDKRSKLPEEHLEKLASSLEEINALLDRHKEHKKTLVRLVRELLDGVRFLFKADHYREEQEVRVIEMYYDADGKKPPDGGVATEHLPPRFYLNIPGNIRFSEVILGPKTHDVSQWKRYLRSCQGKKVHVRKSEIKFGQADQ